MDCNLVTHLELRRVVAETCWNSKEESIVLLEGLWVGQCWDAAVFGRSVHFRQDLLRESLLDLVKIGGTTGLLDALLLSLCESLHMAVHGVLCPVG